MANLFKVTAKGKWIASVHAVAPVGFIGAPFPDSSYLAPDRAAIRAALPHYWRPAFDKAQLSRYSNRDGQQPGDECVFYRVHNAKGAPLVTVYCEPYTYPA